MILIIGGAYQGKLEFVKREYALDAEDIFFCKDNTIDFGKKCIYALENFTRSEIEPLDFFKRNHDKWQNSIIVCRDIFCGIVPLDAEDRAWRRRTGELTQFLAEEAEHIGRIFCGLEQKLK